MLEINNQTNLKLEESFLKDVVAKLKKRFLSNKKLILSLAFIGPREMKMINKKFRGIDQVTDVLSFVLDSSKDQIEGELIICLKKAIEQAYNKKHDLTQEIGILLVHGFLHLLGYDHETESDYQKMNRVEIDFIKDNL